MAIIRPLVERTLTRGRPRGQADIRRRTLRSAVMDLINEGLTQVEIARQLGVDQSTVSRHYRAALEFIPFKTVDQRRELALMELDEATEKALEIMRADHPYVSEGRIVYPVIGRDDEGKPIYGDRPLQDAKAPLQAITTLVAVKKREMDQIGGDAPKRLETVNAHVSAQDLRVSALLGDLERANAGSQKAIAARVAAKRQLGPSDAVRGVYGGLRVPCGAAERRASGIGADPKRVAGWLPHVVAAIKKHDLR